MPINELPRKLGNGICTGVFWEAIFVTEWLPKNLTTHKQTPPGKVLSELLKTWDSKCRCRLVLSKTSCTNLDYDDKFVLENPWS